MESLNIERVVEVCSKYLENPIDENNTKLFTELKKDLIIKSYIPVSEKVMILFKMSVDADKPVNIPSSIFTVGAEVVCLFDALFAYTNIGIDFDDSFKTYENYDLIYSSGLADYILEFCHRDYDRLVHMFERTISYENLQDLTETLSKLDTKEIAKLTNSFKSFKDENPQKFKDMADILRLNDDSLVGIKEAFEEDALDKALSKNKEE